MGEGTPTTLDVMIKVNFIKIKAFIGHLSLTD